MNRLLGPAGDRLRRDPGRRGVLLTDRPPPSITATSDTPAPTPPPAPPAVPRRRGPAEVLQRQARRETLTRRIRFLVGATITCDVLGAVVAIAVGHRSGSTALIGSGLDSIIEVSSAAAVARRFSARDHARRGAREAVTLRIIAISFSVPALHVSVESLRTLVGAAQRRRDEMAAQVETTGAWLTGLRTRLWTGPATPPRGTPPQDGITRGPEGHRPPRTAGAGGGRGDVAGLSRRGDRAGRAWRTCPRAGTCCR